MTLELLEYDMKLAWKSGDMFKKNVLANMLDAVKKASMTSKGRVEITDALVNETLIKYQKTVQEQYDTCPDDSKYAKRRVDYLTELNIVKEYAPQLITDIEEIKSMIKAIALEDTNMALTKNNRGYIMKVLSTKFRGATDMSVVSKAVGELLQNSV